MPLMPGMTMASYPSIIAEGLFYRACLVVAVVVVLGAVASHRWLAQAARSPYAQRPAGAAARDTLAYWLGALWVLDGFLQAQPLMATRFVGGFLGPLLNGQPGPVAALIHLGMRVWGVSPIWFNVLATFLQLLVGLALLFGRDGSPLRRAALIVSIAWAAVVWSVGEAFGSLFRGGGALVGSPGSVFVYGVAALLLLQPDRAWQDGRIWRWMAGGFAALFAFDAVLQVLPFEGWWQTGALSAYVLGMAGMPQPFVLAWPLAAWAGLLGANAVGWNLAITAASAALCVAWLVRPGSTYVWWATIVWIVAFWYLGQDFGVLGGMGTDPNTGAILLAFAIVWGRHVGVLGRVRDRARAAPEVTGHA